jgi:hypothetical protein
MSGVALIASDKFGLKYGPVVLALGPVAYFFFRRRSPTVWHSLSLLSAFANASKIQMPYSSSVEE